MRRLRAAGDHDHRDRRDGQRQPCRGEDPASLPVSAAPDAWPLDACPFANTHLSAPRLRAVFIGTSRPAWRSAEPDNWNLEAAPKTRQYRFSWAAIGSGPPGTVTQREMRWTGSRVRAASSRRMRQPAARHYPARTTLPIRPFRGGPVSSGYAKARPLSGRRRPVGRRAGGCGSRGRRSAGGGRAGGRRGPDAGRPGRGVAAASSRGGAAGPGYGHGAVPSRGDGRRPGRGHGAASIRGHARAGVSGHGGHMAGDAGGPGVRASARAGAAAGGHAPAVGGAARRYAARRGCPAACRRRLRPAARSPCRSSSRSARRQCRPRSRRRLPGRGLPRASRRAP